MTGGIGGKPTDKAIKAFGARAVRGKKLADAGGLQSVEMEISKPSINALNFGVLFAFKIYSAYLRALPALVRGGEIA